MGTKKISMNPWDFTLFESDNVGYVMKIIFSEGDYKVDVERFVIVGSLVSGKENDIEFLKSVAKQIRDNYSSYTSKEISKADFSVL